MAINRTYLQRFAVFCLWQLRIMFHKNSYKCNNSAILVQLTNFLGATKFMQDFKTVTNKTCYKVTHVLWFTYIYICTLIYFVEYTHTYIQNQIICSLMAALNLKLREIRTSRWEIYQPQQVINFRLIIFLAFSLVNENLWWFSINKDSKQDTDKWEPCECVLPPFRHGKHED